MTDAHDWPSDSSADSQPIFDDELRAMFADASNQLGDLTEIIAAGTQAYRDARTKILSPEGLFEPLDQVCLDDGRGGGLGPWLDKLVALADSGRGDEARQGLAAWRKLADATIDRARAILVANQSPLRRRNELRGLLEGFQDKADKWKLVEDHDLSAGHARAYRLLHTAPTNVDLAERAVDTYLEAVNVRIDEISAGGDEGDQR